MKVKMRFLPIVVLAILFSSAMAKTDNRIVLTESESQAHLNSASDEQWQLQMIKAQFAWDMGAYGNGVNVAVIDTGCNPHEDINLAGGYNFILNNEDYSDNHGHGTHIAGLISAVHNKTGIDGAAPKANIYALKCIDPNYVIDEKVLAAAIYAAVDKYKCKVINMSIGILKDEDWLLYEAVQSASDSGVIIVAAAGNDVNDNYNKSRMYYPAVYNEVIGVGSVGITKKRSDFSQQNDSVFVAAPGENCKSTVGTTEYDIKSGTSQATPFVAAAAAILFSADENMTTDEFKNYIIKCSEPIEDEYCGYGLLNIEGMFKACIGKTDFYVSPINKDGVIIYNNSDELLNATGIFAEYKDYGCALADVCCIRLLPHDKIKINNCNIGENTKFFLWDENKFLKPLAKSRKGEF